MGWGEPIAGGTILSLFWSFCRAYKKKPTTSNTGFLGNVEVSNGLLSTRHHLYFLGVEQPGR